MTAAEPLAPRLEIQRATYAAVDDASRNMDVTEKIAELTKSGRVDIRVGNDVFGRDLAFSHVKHLVVEYSLDGKLQQAAATRARRCTCRRNPDPPPANWQSRAIRLD